MFYLLLLFISRKRKLFSIIYEKSKDNLTLWTECLCLSIPPSNSYMEILMHSVMVFGSGAFAKLLGDEPLCMGLVPLKWESPESSFTASAM